MTDTEKTNEAPNGPSASKAMLDGKLSPEQIKNWRKVLAGMIGPAAFIIPDSRVQEFRDAFQAKADSIAD